VSASARATPFATAVRTPGALPTRSGVLPVIRDRLNNGSSAVVLDVGPPDSGILDFLHGAACRVYFNTTRGAFPDRLRLGQLTAENLPGLLDSLVPRQRPVAFDLVFLWHYLDYLDRELIQVFLRWLIALCRPGAWLYFMTHQGTTLPRASAPLHISPDGEIEFPHGAPGGVAPRHPTRVFMDWMPGWRMHKLYLTQSGVQENLFQFGDAPGADGGRHQG